jgi:hypothetical protein
MVFVKAGFQKAEINRAGKNLDSVDPDNNFKYALLPSKGILMSRKKIAVGALEEDVVRHVAPPKSFNWCRREAHYLYCLVTLLNFASDLWFQLRRSFFDKRLDPP